MRVYCNRCKSTLSQGDRFCRYCGSNDIIEEKPEPENKPTFEIEGDVLRKYNRKFEEDVPNYKTIEAEFYGGYIYPHTSPCDRIFKALCKYLNNGTSNERFDRWKNETSINIPSSVRKIEGRNDNPVFPRNKLYYSIYIPSNVSIIKKESFYESIIGYLNIPSSLINNEGWPTNGLYGAAIYKLKIEEGPSTLYIGKLQCDIHTLILPRSLRVLNCETQHSDHSHGAIEMINEMTIPSSVTEIDLNIFLCFKDHSCNYEGRKSQFKSISKFKIGHWYFGNMLQGGTRLYRGETRRYYHKEFCTVHCSDGDLRFYIGLKDPYCSGLLRENYILKYED